MILSCHYAHLFFHSRNLLIENVFTLGKQPTRKYEELINKDYSLIPRSRLELTVIAVYHLYLLEKRRLLL